MKNSTLRRLRQVTKEYQYNLARSKYIHSRKKTNRKRAFSGSIAMAIGTWYFSVWGLRLGIKILDKGVQYTGTIISSIASYPLPWIAAVLLVSIVFIKARFLDGN